MCIITKQERGQIQEEGESWVRETSKMSMYDLRRKKYEAWQVRESSEDIR